MFGSDRPISRPTAGESSAGGVASTLVTGVAILGAFVALGLVAKAVYDALPGRMALPGLVVTLAVLGFGGLYAILRIRDWLG